MDLSSQSLALVLTTTKQPEKNIKKKNKKNIQKKIECK